MFSSAAPVRPLGRPVGASAEAQLHRWHWRPQILLSMRDEGTSQMLVMLLRFVTSAEIQRRTDFFAPFVLGMTDMTVGEFCNKSGD